MSRIIKALCLLAAIVGLPWGAGFVIPWSQVNCWHEDVDLQTGRTRTTRYYGFLPVSTRSKNSVLTSALLPADIEGIVPDWQRVNTFSPGVRYSPHYRYHGALHQIRELEFCWQIGKFDQDARRATALELLKTWQEGGSDFKAGKFLEILSQFAIKCGGRDQLTTSADVSEFLAALED